MAKRRTSGVQRRTRASEAAMSRRAGTGATGGIDLRILILLGILVIGGVVLMVVLLFGGGGESMVGQRIPDDGQGHVPDCQVGGYSSVPATSGCHQNTPGNWGVYSSASPAVESQVIHNLEHGGIVIWFQPGQLDTAGIDALTTYVRQQNQTNRYKVILSPWTGTAFEAPVAVTAWNWLLYLDSADLDQVREFIDDHYGDAPEPNGGPGPPPA
jgi:hypothetical protein